MFTVIYEMYFELMGLVGCFVQARGAARSRLGFIIVTVRSLRPNVEVLRPEFLFPLIPASTPPKHYVKRVLRSFVSSRRFDAAGRVLYAELLGDLLRFQAAHEGGAGWDGETWMCGACVKEGVKVRLGAWIGRTEEGLVGVEP